MDREPVDLARDRLARIGYRFTLVAADGADGLPEHAPYDRIMATCSVPAIPRAWLEQTRVGELILADLKLSVHAGNLVPLTRLANRAEGRFDRTWAGFMALRPNVLWHDLGQAGWGRFGLTTTEQQWIWLDSPDSDHTWPLVTPSASNGVCPSRTRPSRWGAWAWRPRIHRAARNLGSPHRSAGFHPDHSPR